MREQHGMKKTIQEDVMLIIQTGDLDHGGDRQK